MLPSLQPVLLPMDPLQTLLTASLFPHLPSLSPPTESFSHQEMADVLPHSRGVCGIGLQWHPGSQNPAGRCQNTQGGWDRAGRVCWMAATAPEDSGTNLKDLKGWSKNLWVWPVGSPQPSRFCVSSNSSRDNVTYTEITFSFDFAQN